MEPIDYAWLFAAFAFMFASGVTFGVGHVEPWLRKRDARRLAKLERKRLAKAEPSPILPMMWVETIAALNSPAVTRRRRERN